MRKEEPYDGLSREPLASVRSSGFLRDRNSTSTVRGPGMRRRQQYVAKNNLPTDRLFMKPARSLARSHASVGKSSLAALRPLPSSCEDPLTTPQRTTLTSPQLFLYIGATGPPLRQCRRHLHALSCRRRLCLEKFVRNYLQ